MARMSVFTHYLESQVSGKVREAVGTAVLSLNLSDSLPAHTLQATRLLWPQDFPGKDSGVVCRLLLQGIFPTQGLNPRLPPRILHCRPTVLPLSHRGNSPGKVDCQNKCPQASLANAVWFNASTLRPSAVWHPRLCSTRSHRTQAPSPCDSPILQGFTVLPGPLQPASRPGRELMGRSTPPLGTSHSHTRPLGENQSRGPALLRKTAPYSGYQLGRF